MSRSHTDVPASTWFHRALVALIPAASLSLVAYQHDWQWFLIVPALACWVLGIYFLKRGADRLRLETGGRQSR